MSKPKTLIYDIEVSPCTGWFWRTGTQYIGAHNIRKSGKIICISYRFTHWKAGHVKNLQWSGTQCDKEMVKKFSAIAQKADLIVGHNGDGFDKKWINTRLAYFKCPTIKHVMTEDTLKQARQQFNLPSFRLDYLCKYFDIKGKISTSSDLWEKVVFDNDRTYLKKMVKYCDNDVLILDELYNRIYPYVKHKINIAVYNDDERICPSCGGKCTIKNGFAFSGKTKKQRYGCQDCGNTWTGKNAIKKPGRFLNT